MKSFSMFQFSTAHSARHGQFDGGISVAHMKEKGILASALFMLLMGSSFDGRH